MTTINFKAISKYDETIFIEGQTTINDLDNDEGKLLFYDENNKLSEYLPKNPFDLDTQLQDYTNFEALKEAFQYDEEVIQFLSDFAEENKTIIRGHYILQINGGDNMSVKQILTRAEKNKDTKVAIVGEATSTDVIKDITEEFNKYADIGGTDKIVRIVIYKNLIMLQAENNGDKVIYCLPKDYPHYKSLVEDLSVFCRANDLIYSKLKA